MITFVTWLWGNRYSAENVNTLRAMVGRWYTAPHRFVCVTNDTAGIDPGIEIVADREDFARIPSPQGGPTCYRRLALFADDAHEKFGDVVVNLDLDLIVTGDLSSLLAGFIAQPHLFFVGWQDPNLPRQICGSLFALRTGYLRDVFSDFKRDPRRAQALALRAGFYGSDQAWISYCLQDAAHWTPADGIYSFKKDKCEALPANARIVVFHGDPKPWSERCQRIDWIRRHYQ